MNKLIFTTLSLVTLIFDSSKSQDKHLGWTYESTTLPQGMVDIEPWVTFSTGRDQFYTQLKSRLEFEYGLTDRLQTAIYLNTSHKAFVADSAHHPGSDTSVYWFEESSDFSISNEWKLNLLNPSVKPIGLGIYGEYTIAPREIELEYKVLLEKRSEKNIFAFNHVGELEFEFEYENENGNPEIETEKEFILEHDLAWMHMIRNNFGMGTEFRNHSEIVKGELEHSVLFGGLTLFYSKSNENGKSFFIIAAPQVQLANLLSGHSHGDSSLDLVEHERYEFRIIFGIGL